MPPTLRAFAAAVKQRRAELGLTQRELEVAAGLARGGVSHIERLEYSPSLGVAVKLAAGLRTKVGVLLGEVPGDD